MYFYFDEIPPGLPGLLHTPSEGRSSVHGTNSIRKTGSFVRPISPKSPFASASAFESMGESDDDDNLTDTAGLDASYLQTNGDLPADATYGSRLLVKLTVSETPWTDEKRKDGR